MGPIELFVGFTGVFFGLLGLALIFVASIVALFKIDEADRYYGMEGMGSVTLPLKGLPFSLGRMTVYGMVTLFSNTQYVKKNYAQQLEKINANAPPKRLKRLLIWLYASWLLCLVPSVISAGILKVFF